MRWRSNTRASNRKENQKIPSFLIYKHMRQDDNFRTHSTVFTYIRLDCAFHNNTTSSFKFTCSTKIIVSIILITC